jgi:hypothetical protein
VPGQQPFPQRDQEKADDCELQEKEGIINGAVVEHVESLKFLGVHITNKLTWSIHTNTIVKRAQ